MKRRSSSSSVSHVSADAVRFFRKHAGSAKGPNETWAQARTRGAKDLANAEKEMERRGWKVEWEYDQEEYQMGDAEEERPFEVFTAVLRDENGSVLASLGGIGMSGNAMQDRNYRRVVEAELALEAMS